MKYSSVRVVLSATFLLALLVGAKIEALATVRRVPADYRTIQQAINASVNEILFWWLLALMSRTLIFSARQSLSQAKPDLR
jgi:hypothetical protein